jgi:hypothetical protein
MYPILKDRDKLSYIPYGNKEILPGDVVVINAPTGGIVIHRVISADIYGIKTRGDNTPMADPWVLHKEQVMGKVIYAMRGYKELHVYGGLLGRIISAPVKSARFIFYIIYRILRHPYDHLSRSSALCFIPLKTKVLAFQRDDGPELQLFLKGHLIGRKRHCGEWQIKPPFRLFLKEDALSGEIHTIHLDQIKY